MEKKNKVGSPISLLLINLESELIPSR